MSMTKILLASAVAISSVSASFAGGLNTAVVEPAPVVVEQPKFSNMGGAALPLAVVGLVAIAAIASGDDNDDTNSTTATTETVAR